MDTQNNFVVTLRKASLKFFVNFFLANRFEVFLSHEIRLCLVVTITKPVLLTVSSHDPYYVASFFPDPHPRLCNNIQSGKQGGRSGKLLCTVRSIAEHPVDICK